MLAYAPSKPIHPEPMPTPPCPCGGPEYATCCAPWLQGQAAPTPEALMRSRYTAYTQKNEAYLLATWHPSTRPAPGFIDPEEKLQWLGLEVKSDLRLRKRKDARAAGDVLHDVQQTASANPALQEAGDKRQWGTVEFVARFRINGRAQRLHEISRFVCEQEAAGPRWYYVDGSFPEK